MGSLLRFEGGVVLALDSRLIPFAGGRALLNCECHAATKRDQGHQADDQPSPHTGSKASKRAPRIEGGGTSSVWRVATGTTLAP